VQVTFLGTSSGVPTRNRNVSSVALNLPQRGEVWLFDCGEATQHQILRCDVKIGQIRRIFVTHLHGDHIFGLMGLLATYGMAGNPDRIDIYGPDGLKQYLNASQKYSYTHFNYPIKIHTIQPGIVHQEEGFTVRCIPLKHKVPAYGYRVEETDRPGKFDVAKAQELEIPFGPIYGQLKNGQQVTLADGRVIDGSTLCGPAQKGRSVVYCTDTVFCENSIDLARDADLLIHESTFAHEDAEMAFDRLHSTCTMAAQVALNAQVRQLILTHFSPRYAPGNAIGLEDLLQTARSIFPHTEMAQDFLSYTVPRREEG
jgi:ribonuclease Z